MYTQTNIHIVFVCFPFSDSMLHSIVDALLDSTFGFHDGCHFGFHFGCHFGYHFCIQLLHPTFGFYVGFRFGFHLWVPSWIPLLDPALGFWLWIPSLDSMLDPTVDSKLQGNAGATPGQRRGHAGATAGQRRGNRLGRVPVTAP